MASLESMHNRGEVRMKQARRMIAATKTQSRRFFFFHPPRVTIFFSLRFTLWCDVLMSAFSSFFSSSFFHHATSQMARRQTSQGRPMKTSTSLRVHSNCTWGICLFPSSHMTLTQGSLRLRVSRPNSFRNTPLLSDVVVASLWGCCSVFFLLFWCHTTANSGFSKVYLMVLSVSNYLQLIKNYFRRTCQLIHLIEWTLTFNPEVFNSFCSPHLQNINPLL